MTTRIIQPVDRSIAPGDEAVRAQSDPDEDTGARSPSSFIEGRRIYIRTGLPCASTAPPPPTAQSASSGCSRPRRSRS
jgi:hypothetical protein